MKQHSTILVLLSLLLTTCDGTPAPNLGSVVQTVDSVTSTVQPAHLRTLAPTSKRVTSTPTLGPGEAKIRSADNTVMVYVPSGVFQMGSDEIDRHAKASEKPPHAVTVDAFWIDKYEVSNAQYARCVEVDACQEAAFARDVTYNKADFPVVGVSWKHASDYCLWAGGRLPTEAEWEYAARGPERPIYPWGDTFESSQANVRGDDDNYEYTAPVDSFPAGASWVGAVNMAGNVWEWVETWYDGYPGTTFESDYFGTTYKVLRGGGWDIDAEYVRAANRLPVPPVIYPNYVGFRCVVEEHE
jgi:formylglycine-generating enzyme required for sulfatase activity